MSNAPLRSLSRRSFLQAGLALGAFAATCSGADAPRRYRSHGPWAMFGDNPRKWIQERVLPPAEGRRVADGVFCSTRLENVFYLDLGEHAVVIDSGFDHQVEHHLRNFRSMGLDLGKVAGILVTHSHVDHTGGVRQMRDKLGVPVIAHLQAKAPIEPGDLLRTAAVIPELDGWEFDYPACPIDHVIQQGDLIRCGQEEFHVIHMPGHTPDSVGYLWRDRFFVGDAIFFGGLVGWADERWLSNYSDHADSMQRLLDQPVTATHFHCAHGPELPYGANVPAAIKKTLLTLTPVDEDPCNHTPRAALRAEGDEPDVLQLA